MYFNKIKIFTLIKKNLHKVCIHLSLREVRELGGGRERRKEGVGKKRESEVEGEEAEAKQCPCGFCSKNFC